MKRVLLTVLLLGLCPGLFAKEQPFDSADFNTSSKPLSLQRITPAGKDVSAGRQVVLQFSRPVVPVGKMDRDASEIPVTIMPALHCEWRWLNTSALACQLREKDAMRPATRYRVLVQPGITAEDGSTLAGPVAHEFITRRPEVNYYRFETWLAPGMPLIRISFNQPVSRDSVQQHIHMRLKNAAASQVPVRAVEPKHHSRQWMFFAHKGEPVALAVKTEKAENPLDLIAEQEQPAFSQRWIVAPRTLLPEDTTVHLRMEPGLESEYGPERGVEHRTVVEFDTFPEFAFLGVECTNTQDAELVFPADAKLSRNKACDPLRPVRLRFSAPVIAQVVKENLVIEPDLAGGRKDYDPWQRLGYYSQLRRPHQRGHVYTLTLPEYLKAYHSYHFSAAPAEFKDEFGRPLVKRINLRLRTDHRRPDYSFEHNVSVLEKGVDSEVPVVVTNLKHLNFRYDRLTANGVERNLKYRVPVPQATDIAFKMPLQVRDLLKGESGVIEGRFDTTPQVRSWGEHFRDPEWFFGQVTPFDLQVKLGHHNTLVWVTDFATGQPVAGARLKLYEDNPEHLSATPAIAGEGVTDDDGVAVLPGLAEVDPELDVLYDSDRAWFLRCEKDRDLALLSMQWDFSLGTQTDIYPDVRKRYGHIHTWGTTAQGVYKAGDTIQYKILVRDQDNRRFVAAPREGYTLTITDPMGKKVHEVKDLALSEFGGYAGEFTVAKNGAVGWYHFRLSAGFTDQTWSPLRVLVSDFTPSPFRVQTEVDGTTFESQAQITLSTRATLHAGGPYADAPAQVYVNLNPRALLAKSTRAKGFRFDTLPEEDVDNTVYQAEGRLNAQGEWQTTFTLPESALIYGTLAVESTVRDDRGKDVAARTQARYTGRDRFVGLKAVSWMATEDQPATVQYLVVDADGELVTDTAVSIAIERRETKAARVKGAGNAYLTQYHHEWVAAGECSGTPAGDDPANCVFTPEHAGYYRLTATIQDTKQRAHSTALYQWVSGKGDVVWETSPGYELDLEPEKTDYQVGDTARFLVKNPYPGARALITVERYGILKHWVTTLENSMEIIELPVEADYIPGYFLSVVVMSPRLDKPLDENQVDLGKPALRVGYVEMAVRDPYKELTVDVQSDKPVYRPREQVTVDLHATAKRPEGFSDPIELAVTVLDESVFDLIAQGKGYFDPYQGFYTLDGLDVRNFNLLMRLVGRQKFEKKGANPGGDGGADLSLRSLFKFVSYWNPAVTTDAAGKAQIQFKVPDNLTGWRVLAMAVTPTDRMGLSDANFKVNRPIEIRPVMPNQVTQGDSFSGGFSVMNRSEQARTLKVSLSAKGPLQFAEGQGSVTLEEQITLEPFKRQTVWLPLKTQGDGELQFIATASDNQEKDAVKHTLPVRKRRSLETGATYGTTVSDAVSESVQFPADIHPDAGGVRVTAAPTVITNVDGAFEYLRDYPYVCWEQKLTKGTMASHYTNLKAWLPDALTWPASADLPALTVQEAATFQAPNGGMAYFVPSDERVSPYLSAYTALAFNWLRGSGHNIPGPVEDKLHEYLVRLLRKDVQPSFYTPGMSSTVRAVALNALAAHGKVRRADLNRYHPHVPRMSLFGKANFLDAAMQVKGTLAIRQQSADAILAHSVQSGGKISFNEELDDAYSRILATPLRTNCAILSALSRYAAGPGAKGVGDVPMRLVRYISASRGSRTHWENTQENMFCMNALIDYARVYEKDAPDMAVKVLLDSEKLGETTFDDVRDPQVSFEHAMTPADPGRKAKVNIERNGDGRLYYGVYLQYAPTADNADPVNAGIEIRREYHVERDGEWVLLQSPMALKTGDLVRVDLYLSLPTARNFVVVDDPVPGGLEPVNRDLATASQVATDKAGGDYAGGSFWFSRGDWNEYGTSFWSFYHKELRHHAVRFYSDWLAPGNYHLSYTAQAIAPGEFSVMPVHAEEMYDPDVYGKGVPEVLGVVR